MLLETDYLMYMVFMLTTQIAYGVLHLFFAFVCYKNHPGYTPLAISIAISLLWFLFGCIFVKIWNKKIDLENGTSELEKVRQDFKIAFGGSTALGIANQLAAVFLSDYRIIIGSIYFFCFISSSLLSIFFLVPNFGICFLKSANYYKTLGKTIVLHILFFYFSNFYPAENRSHRLQLQCLIAIMSCSFMTDYQILVGGGIELCAAYKKKVVKTRKDEPESEGEEDEMVMGLKELECKICMLQFSEKSKRRTPRLLTYCGHTVCHKCITNLIKANRKVTCPICRQETFVIGGNVSKLPKNWMMVGLIQEIKATNYKT